MTSTAAGRGTRSGSPTRCPDCTPYEQGTNGQVESFLDYGSAAPPARHAGLADLPRLALADRPGRGGRLLHRASSGRGRPACGSWSPSWSTTRRCATLMTTRRNPCNDMDAVRLQARDLRALQDYIDAQSGGPGKGFFRIVTNPFQARQVINQGKLAVVEGIEVSHLFNCGEYLGVPAVQRRPDRRRPEGGPRRSGSARSSRSTSSTTPSAARRWTPASSACSSTAATTSRPGSFWDVKTCTGPEHDQTQLTMPVPAGRSARSGQRALASRC